MKILPKYFGSIRPPLLCSELEASNFFYSILYSIGSINYTTLGSYSHDKFYRIYCTLWIYFLLEIRTDHLVYVSLELVV